MNPVNKSHYLNKFRKIVFNHEGHKGYHKGRKGYFVRFSGFRKIVMMKHIKRLKLKICFLLYVIIFLGCNTCETPTIPGSSQEITLHFIGKKFEQLYLKADIWAPNHASNIKFFKGQSHDGYRWIFNVPDSINQLVDYYVIITQPFESKTNTFYSAKFLGLNKNDSSVYNLVFDEKHPVVEATYLYTRQSKGVYGTGNFFIVNDTTIVDGISKSTDVFRVNFKYPDTELEVSMRLDSFGYIDNDNYLIAIKKMDSISKKYCDSKYLMRKLWEVLDDFENINDAKKIFSNFSQRNQSSGYGKLVGEIFNLYSTRFNNITILNASTDTPEKIILDSTRYNLLIFSASWCVPCHEMIPELKVIYKDLKDNIDFVYISLDENKYVNSWKKLMKDKAIPWRSLLASGHVKEIEDMYDARSLPHTLLVYPNMTVRKIDIRNSEDRDKLYQLVNK